MIELRPYQQEIATAVVKSVQEGQGLTFSVEIARQGGKNEVSAQLEVLLLVLHAEAGGNLIKCSPTFKPQTIISMQRLKDRLKDWGLGQVAVPSMGYMIGLGKATAIFLSADETANVVGNTAHILMEIDESQDVSKEKYSKEFRPMGATTNVTTIHWGTTWDDSTLLEETKQLNIELEARDGIRRHFRYPWQEVAKYNPLYAGYVEGERVRLGDTHPLFLTQYCLEPIRGGGRFFSPAQLVQLQGEHPRRETPDHSMIYLAGLDLAGEAEQIDDIMLESVAPARDAAVLTIGSVSIDPISKLARVNIVQQYEWIGVAHPIIYRQLLDILKMWKVARVVVDATGVGEPVASFLRAELGSSVEPFKFTQKSKSDLGFNLLAQVNSSGLKMYVRDNSIECTQFWHQAGLARAMYRPNQTINFFLDPGDGHDDYLMSEALIVEAARDFKPRTAKGRRK